MNTLAKPRDFHAAGELVAWPLQKSKTSLNGFWARGARLQPGLLLFVHGMGSNFYRSRLKKEFMLQCGRLGFDALLFNNRGAEDGTIDERFSDCLEDLDAALLFGRRQGYRRFVLIGHSTGCQKSVYYQSRRQRSDIKALVLLSPADDHALCRRDLGKRFASQVRKARNMVELGMGHQLVQGLYETFSARRFLSVADPRQAEAGIFHYHGPLAHFRKIQTPMLAVFGSREEYAILPPAKMLEILQQRSRSSHFDTLLIPEGDHSFHGLEESAVRQVLAWAKAQAETGR
ncbi:MAG: alpha/beta fold hydrolase [Lentisphaerota bacterium]